MIDKALKKLDIIVGVTGCLIGGLIIYLSYFMVLLQYDIGFVTLSASLIYLIFRGKLTKSSIDFSFKPNGSMIILLSIIFMVLFTICILLLRLNLYHRPPIYFILISVMSGIIAIEIFYFNKNMKIWLIILQILLLSLNIRAGLFYEFNDLIGCDIRIHTDIAESIANMGFITPETMHHSKYISYPIFHLGLAITQLVSSLNIKDSLFFVVVFFSTISTVFIYLIGKSIVGEKFGLFAMLLANVSDLLIVRSVTSITPGSLVFCWFLIIIYLIFKDSKNTSIDAAIKLFLILLLIITHQLSTFASFIGLMGIFLGKQFYDYFYTKRDYNKVNHIRIGINMTTVLVFGVALQSYWMYAYTGPGRTFFDFAINPVVNVLKHGDFISDISSNPYVTYYSHFSILSNTLFHFGYLILLFFAIIGALIWFSKKNIDNKKLTIIMGVFVLYLFVYGLPLTGMGSAGIWSRWLVFIYAFLVLLAAQSIFGLTGLIKRNKVKIFAISSITLLLTFIMITTPYINGDSPIYCKDRWPRAMLKDSELQAAKTISNIYTGEIKIDRTYLSAYVFNATVKAMVSSDEKSLNEGMIILRECMKKGPVSITMVKGELGVVRVLGEGFFKRFETSTHNLVYDDGEVKAYLSNENRWVHL